MAYAFIFINFYLYFCFYYGNMQVTNQLMKGCDLMEKNRGIYEQVGERLKMFIDYMGVEIEDISAVSGLSEKRINEIIEVKGKKVTLEEIAILQRRALVSVDYLVGVSDYPFPIEPTDENRKELAYKIKTFLTENK